MNLAQFDAMFRHTPVETGMAHPVENALKTLLAHDTSGAMRIVDAMLAVWPERHADILRCVCHVPADGEASMRWIARALAHPDFEVRDAAIHAVETWDRSDLWAILRLHRDADPFLAEYVERLLAERVI